MARRRLPLAALAAAVAVGGGCAGGDERLSKNEYEREVSTVLVDIKARSAKLGLAIGRAPAPHLAEGRVKTLRKVIQDSAERLERIEPPRDVERPHARLVEALVELDAELEEAEEATRKLSYEGWPTFLEDLRATDAVRQIARSTRELGERGYQVTRRPR